MPRVAISMIQGAVDATRDLAVAVEKAGVGATVAAALHNSEATPVGVIDVLDYATGNGTTDDTAAIAEAAADAISDGKRLYFPAGTYKVSTWTPPSNLYYYGVGSTSYIKGKVLFGTGQTAKSLRIGSAGVALAPVNGAHDSLFDSCTIVGGPPCLAFPSGYTAYNITFRGCTIDPSRASYGNAVGMSHMNENHYYHDIVFDTCHFMGATRMTVEILQRGDSTTSVGYTDINFLHCLFEPCDEQTLSYDCPVMADGTTVSGYSRVEGCTFLGSGLNTTGNFPHHLEVNGPRGMVITGNTFYSCRKICLNFHGSSGANVGGHPLEWVTVTNNTFDFTQGATPHESNIYFSFGGSGTVFYGNTVLLNKNGPIFTCYEGPNLIQNNTFTDTRASGGSGYFINLSSAPGNRFEDNEWTVANQRIRITSGSSTAYFYDNVFNVSYSEANLYVVDSGVSVVKSGNTYA